MSQSIGINNFNSPNIVEISKLDANMSIGATSVTLAYSDNLAVGDYIVIGTLGSEKSELSTIATKTSSVAITVGAITKPHNRFDAVTKLFGNKVKLYRAANVNGQPPDDADFSYVDTIDIDIDQVSTFYTDPDGDETYWYKSTYFNSTANTETALGDSTANRSVGDYCSIEDIRQEAGLTNNRWISDSQIDEKRKAAQQEINATLNGLYTVPFTAPINPFIRDLTRRLAAGLLLTSPWAGSFTSTNSEGQAKLDNARSDLHKLDTRELTLTDPSGTPITNSSVGGFSAWPNSTTATADPSVGGGERKFRVSDRY